jgi:hypothetical protein
VPARVFAGTFSHQPTGLRVPDPPAVSVQVNGLTNTTTAGSYTSEITTENLGSPIDSGVTPAVSFTGSQTLTAPGSLGWAATLNGSNLSAVDTVPADQQLTVDDMTGTGAGEVRARASFGPGHPRRVCRRERCPPSAASARAPQEPRQPFASRACGRHNRWSLQPNGSSGQAAVSRPGSRVSPGVRGPQPPRIGACVPQAPSWHASRCPHRRFGGRHGGSDGRGRSGDGGPFGPKICGSGDGIEPLPGARVTGNKIVRVLIMMGINVRLVCVRQVSVSA